MAKTVLGRAVVSGFCSCSTHGNNTWHRCWQSWVNLLSEEMEMRWEPPKRAKECFQTVRWSSLLAPSTWWTWQPLLLQLARILESAKLKAELLNYGEKTDSCISLYTVIHTYVYIYTHTHAFIHIMEWAAPPVVSLQDIWTPSRT